MLGSKYSIGEAPNTEKFGGSYIGPGRQTNASTVSIKKSYLGGVEKTSLPGPGSYEYKKAFPNGPKAVIERKNK